MLMNFNSVKGFLNGSEILVQKEREATNLFNYENFNCCEISQNLFSKKEGNVTVILNKDELGNWFFYEMNSNNKPIIIVSDECFTDKDLWYCIGNNKEQLRHLLFLYRKNERKNNTYKLLKKTAGDALAS